jgi:hypothetical protein
VQEALLVHPVVEVFAYLRIWVLPRPHLHRMLYVVPGVQVVNWLLVVLLSIKASMERVSAWRPIRVLIHTSAIATCGLTQNLPYVEHELRLVCIDLLHIVIVYVRVYQPVAVSLQTDL